MDAGRNGLRSGDSGAKVLFADQERLDRLTEITGDVDIRTIAVRPHEGVCEYPVLAELLAERPATPMPDMAPDPEDIATIFYTSGSTGHPKGVASCHRNIIAALLSWELDGAARARELGVTPEPPPHQLATLLAVPLFHATGSHAVYLSSYRAQRKLVCMYRSDPALAAELIEAEKISSVIAPAAMTADLVNEAGRTNRDLSTLVSVGGGGAPRAPEQVKRIGESFGQAMPSTGWGMTETNAIGTGISRQEYLDRPESSGRCSAVLELRIVDTDGNVLPANERGELQVRGTSVFKGYWNRPDANAETFDEDGWMRTGDVAYLDDEGYLFIVDRIKDLVIRGGENIGCGEVEAALLMHPDILEASVTRYPMIAWVKRLAPRSMVRSRPARRRSGRFSRNISPDSRSRAICWCSRRHCHERHRARYSSESCKAKRWPIGMLPERSMRCGTKVSTGFNFQVQLYDTSPQGCLWVVPGTHGRTYRHQGACTKRARNVCRARG
ncbi:MAG: fatty acid--CoA ligase family protein [Gammaproteobacteria bacterium]|nr:fatty acid--CoA ligase family protein [Gammaproteobacteria bacterium]